ncbi:hypothetical protein J5N97_028578 [Dioscorea zingiberensis]|uniref:Uncharacterized protein n=1 Tax=Dioscorea zingiberensis TaxID=325984 RepID=A0A9D5BYS8_9LILI|nr:hypothetical protein J5N97_028578 [Dioscorea zingiberensis]
MDHVKRALDDWVLCRVRHKNAMPIQAEDDNISTKPCHKMVNHQVEKQGGMKRVRSGLFEETDYQLLAYLLGTHDEGDNNSSYTKCQSSDVGSNQICPNYEATTTSGIDDDAQPLHQVLDSIKRKLSFGALDEFLMLTPNKRFNNHGTSHSDQFSPTQSDSAGHGFPDFLI